jgi:hypothetical protein
MSPADILSTQDAASLQRRSFRQERVGSASRSEATGTVDPAWGGGRSAS